MTDSIAHCQDLEISLRVHPLVHDVRVAWRTEISGHRAQVAYVVTSRAVRPSQLRTELAAHLGTSARACDG